MKRILVIDENNHDAKKLEIYLSEAGYKTYIAENGSNGFEIAKRYFPDLILCSLNIQFENGRNVFVELVNYEPAFIIPKICILENSNHKEIKQVMSIGADDFIEKPIDKNELLLSVNTRLKKFDALKQNCDKFHPDRFEEENIEPEYDDHILVKIGNKLNFIKFSEIICVTASKEYSKINMENGKKIIVRKSLKKWIEVLPEDIFLQIHRGSIINMDFIEEAKKISGRSYQVRMKCVKEELILSKRFANKLRKKFPFL